jgi:hypothetical protein
MLMKTTTILAVVAIVAALGAVTSFVPIHQASAAPCSLPTVKGPTCREAGGEGGPQVGNGLGALHANTNSDNQGTRNALHFTPFNQPCSHSCSVHFQSLPPL